ncbi:MAG: hypothetical protein ACP5RI_00870 [Candidatus Micrarchaeia archaeon]
MVNGENVQYCQKCGVKLTNDNRKYVREANGFFCKKCAAEIESFFKAEHTCAICNKKFGKFELKIAVSDSILNNSSNMSGNARNNLKFVCADCYNKLTSRNVSRINTSKTRIEEIRKDIRRSIVSRQLKR